MPLDWWRGGWSPMANATRARKRPPGPVVRRLAGMAALALAILLPSARPAAAQGAFVLLNERNHPELQWQQIRSDHFQIVYHEPLEPWAREAMSILERFHAPLCRRLDTYPDRRTRVYLSDQDQIANGAAVGDDYFFVWIPSHPATRSFSGARPWFQEVLIHEYAHILVARASSTWLGNLAYPLGLYPPRWLHEGIAQWTAENWNVLRGDRTLAAAILDGSIERNPPGVPGSGRLLYARGHARVRWMASAYGDSTIPRLIRAAGPLGVYTYRSAERRAIGKESGKALDRFRREMIAYYGARFRAGEPPESLGPAIDTGLEFPSALAWGRNGERWITGQQAAGPGESSLFLRRGNRSERIVPGGVAGKPIPLDNGAALLPRFHRASNGSWSIDLGLWDPGDGFRFVGRGERIGEIVRLDDTRILALRDDPAGATLERRHLGESGAPVRSELLFRWRPGVAVHSIAASASGDRVLWSEIDPSGSRRRLAVEIDSLDAGADLIDSGAADERDTIWLTDSTLAWTSNRGGRSQIRTGSWTPSAGLLGDSARTAAGVGAVLAGVDGDSLVALDYTTRRRHGVYRIDPRRLPDSHGAFHLPPPFGVDPAVEPEALAPDGTAPAPYRPIREIRPWLRLPLAGPQAGRLGLGGGGLWAEPLLKHSFGGYIYGNDEQLRSPDRGFFYMTTRWGPFVAAFHYSQLQPQRLLEHRLLWERREATGVALLTPLQAGDPNRNGWLDLHLKTESRRPRFGGRDLRTPLGAPSAWSSLLMGGGWGCVRVPPHAIRSTGPREGDGMAIRVQGGIDAWGGASRFLRGSIDAFRARPARLPGSPTLHLEGTLRGVSGGFAAQEYEGFDSDPSWRLIGGWPGVDGTAFLRGWPEEKASRFVFRGSVDLRYPILPDLVFRAPGIALGGGTLAPFMELGHAWDGPAGKFGDARARTACGVEARLAGRIGPLPLLASAAWGFGFGREAPEGDWSFRLATALPFQIPLDPPRALGALMGGALRSDSWTRCGAEPGCRL